MRLCPFSPNVAGEEGTDSQRLRWVRIPAVLSLRLSLSQSPCAPHEAHTLCVPSGTDQYARAPGSSDTVFFLPSQSFERMLQ